MNEMDNTLEHLLKRESENFEPKVNNRFIVEFKPPFDIKSYVVHQVARPVYTFDKYNISYDVMVISLYDPIAPSSAREIMEGIRANAGRQPEIEFKLKMMGPVGDTVEAWKIKGELKSVDFGELDWDDSEPTHIIMKIQPIDVILEY